MGSFFGSLCGCPTEDTIPTYVNVQIGRSQLRVVIIGRCPNTEEIHQSQRGHLPETRQIAQGCEALGIVVFYLISNLDKLL